MGEGDRAGLARAWGEVAVAAGRVAWLPAAAEVVRLSRSLGALPWDEVPAGLVADGTYSRLMAAAGVAFGAPDVAAAGLVAGEQRAAAGRLRRRMS